MRYTDILTEAPLPHTDYGFWVDPKGTPHPVGFQDHHDTIQKLFGRDGVGVTTALYLGWARVVSYDHYFGVQLFPSRLSIRALSTIEKIVKSHAWIEMSIEDLDVGGHDLEYSDTAKLLGYLRSARKHSPNPVPARVQAQLDRLSTEPLQEAAMRHDAVPDLFYHGTSSEAAAASIIQNGIVAPDLSDKPNSALRPMVGRVYLTPQISYAAIYAIGGNFLGSTSYQLPYEGNEDKFRHIWHDDPTSRHAGRYGFVFVVPKNELYDVQPDEDEVGELFMHALRDGPSEFHDETAHAVWTKVMADPVMNDRFKAFVRENATPKQLDDIRNGFVSAQARVGKKALKTMPDDMKLWLVELGLHISHAGTVHPSQCWRIDKALVGYLHKDGSNFFDLAERMN